MSLKITIPIDDTQQALLAGTYGGPDFVEINLTAELNALVATRVKKQIDDQSKIDVVGKVDAADAEYIKRVKAILDLPKEKLAFIDTAIADASK